MKEAMHNTTGFLLQVVGHVTALHRQVLPIEP
jgi:hypothetical protein